MSEETIKAIIDTSQTSEKFQNMKDEALSCLITNLLSLNNLEKEYFGKYEALNADKVRLGIPSSQTHPKDDEMWQEYHRRCDEIVTAFCMNPTHDRSMGKPAKYDYLYESDTKIAFIMKSATRAIVETYFEAGRKRHQFILRKADAGWKLERKKYGFGNDGSWSIDHTI